MSNDKVQYNGQNGNGYQPLPCAPTPPPGSEVGAPTLADAQPGGRVRLGDQAERARFEAWVRNHVSSLARAADGEYASNFTHALWSAWQAACPSQPSPAGQGDMRAQFEAWAKSEGYHVERQQRGNVGDYIRDEVRELWGMWLLNPQQLLDAAKKKATSYGRASVQDGASCAGASQAGHSGHVRDARKALDQALAVMSAKAALSAQPSPGGQGDAPRCFVSLDMLAGSRHKFGEVFDHPQGSFVRYEDHVRALSARLPVGEPVGWYTEDHLTDRSATTYDHTIAERWRAKGWPVYPLYGAPPVLFKELQNSASCRP